MKTTGEVINGVFVPDSKVEYGIILQKFEGRRIEIEFSDTQKRSAAQNSFYWGVVIPNILLGFNDHGVGGEILRNTTVKLDDVGMLSYEDRLTVRAVDKYLLWKFHSYTSGMSIRSMGPHLFGSYTMQICIWAKDVLGVEMPEPEPKDENIFNYEIRPDVT